MSDYLQHGRRHGVDGSDPITFPPFPSPVVAVARIHVTDFTQGIGGGNISYGAVDYDTDGMADLGTHAERLTIHTPGYYILTSQCETLFPDTYKGEFFIVLRINGVVVSESESSWTYDVSAPMSGAFAVQTSLVWPMNASDYFETEVDLDRGVGAGAVDVSFGSMAAHYLCPDA